MRCVMTIREGSYARLKRSRQSMLIEKLARAADLDVALCSWTDQCGFTCRHTFLVESLVPVLPESAHQSDNGISA